MKLLLPVLLVSVEAMAQDVSATMHGAFSAGYSHVSSFPLDETGYEDGLDDAVLLRLRLRPQLTFPKNVKLVTAFDVLSGQVFGDELGPTTSTGRPTGREVLLWPARNGVFERAMFREGYVEWRSPVGMLRVGQQAASWGLGMVTSDGEDRDGADAWHGDIVDRVMFVTRPFEALGDAFSRGLHLAVAGDFVYRDENAQALDGDIAFQGVAALFFEREKTIAGVYAAYRHQTYDSGEKLKVTMVDLTGGHTFRLAEGLSLRGEAEGAVLFGSTDRLALARAPRGVDILSFGAVGRVELDVARLRLRPALEVGVASGDKDPGDGTVRAFSFDPDYQVGMILFQEVLARFSTSAAGRVSDPALLGHPPQGYDLTATNGAVTNAVYLYPRIRFWPIKDLEVRAAFLWARALAPVSDPYNTALAGGYPRSYRNGPAGHGLGVEADLGLLWRMEVQDILSLALGLQGGLFVAGDAFADARGSTLPKVFKVRASVGVGF